MQPDEIRSLIEALVDPDHEGVPRVWTTATPVKARDDAVIHRSAPSPPARTAGYDVGLSLQSPRPISKLFPLPDGATPPAVLRSYGAVDLLLAEPVEVDDDAVVVLHGCVIVTIGQVRASLADTQRGKLYLVPRALGEVLETGRGATIASLLDADPDLDPAWIRRWYGALVAEDLAAAVPGQPDVFPTIELRNEPLAGEELDVVDAIVDQDDGSKHDLASLAGELDALRCQHLQLRYFCAVDADRLNADLRAFAGSRVRTIEIVAPWAEVWTPDAIEGLCARHDRVSLMVLHGAPEPASYGAGRYRAELVVASPSSHALCGQVHPGYFSVALEAIQGAELGDTCLRGKVSVDASGAIRHCPSHDRTYGTAGVERLADVVGSERFRKVGSLRKSDVAGCRSCEFRRVCSHCQVQAPSAGSKPSTCSYDPATGEWEA